MTEACDSPALDSMAQQSAAQHPLWPLAVLLGEIAERLEQPRAADKSDCFLFMDDKRKSNQGAGEPEEAA